jgi:glycosyltransferase involved in cell wall biosynthesis
MRRRALLVSTASPFPVVTNGCARLVSDYQRRMFSDHDIRFLLMEPGAWTPAEVDVDVESLLAADFEFVFFIGFKENPFTRALATGLPSFCLTDRLPHPDVPDGLFRGILTHRDDTGTCRPDVALIGGTFDDSIFRPGRADEDIVVSVGRIHPDKGQLELVASYREQVFEPYGLPLHLVGGIDDQTYRAYHDQVARHVDGVSVISTGWEPAPTIADLCNRARLFVSASPRESFGMALIEAMACGTTCVVNGTYSGFPEDELRRHVHGNITGARGCVVELMAKALADDVRLDGSAWAMRYSLSRTRPTVTRFIDARL